MHETCLIIIHDPFGLADECSTTELTLLLKMTTRNDFCIMVKAHEISRIMEKTAWESDGNWSGYQNNVSE